MQRRLTPGARIRFDAPSVGDRLMGTLVSWEADTLTVSVDGDAPGLALMVATDSVTRMEVRGERRMTLEGLGLGVLAGALVALAADPDWVDEDGNCTTVACIAYEVSPNLDTRLGVLGGVGALLGIIVGSETKTERWTSVPLQRLQIGPTREGGLAFGMRIPF
ncbi:MAG TPA: hypothetical protein VFM23_02390 [Gemmatimonadales bacterium]|nr:hypothetical protein [Gemmatimonadales bacterium]